VPSDRLAAAAAAAQSFVERLRPADEVMVLAIGSEVEPAAPLSTSHAAAISALRSIEPWGTTPLHDATLKALDAIQGASGRRALILLSDGEDRYSETTADALLAEARRRDVLVYPVSTGRKRPELFAELASVTGGRSFHAIERRDLEAALATITRELRLQYLLGYTPSAGEGRRGWRSIRVTVTRPDARVRARDGYFVER
jgi:VWFA-related protein